MSSGANEPTAIFVYGTLKRDGTNHGQLAGQHFIATARTVPGFTLYALDGYPGLVADPADHAGVTGELWQVTPECLARLDAFEGVPEGLYRREVIPLVAPHEGCRAEAYVYAQTVVGRIALGSTWPATRKPGR